MANKKIGRPKIYRTEKQRRKAFHDSIKRYQDVHYRSMTFRFNLVTQANLIEMLDSQPNKSGYIASLIEQDIEKKKDGN